MALNPSEKFDLGKVGVRSNICRKVRVVAKIRGSSNLETELPSKTVPSISIHKASEASDRVKLSFGEQPASRKEAHLVDYCYEQNEDNKMIFSREVKPLISGVFEGHNATVIACGARGSGKTDLIQGSVKKPGLAVLAMDEILSRIEQNAKSVSISFYEANHHEHVYDLLDPERPEVFVFEDRAKLPKGISQVLVRSNSEFQRLYLSGCAARKPAQKIAIERPCRSHTGLIVHVFSRNENSDSVHVGKMNFVDLAGYEDGRRRSSDCRVPVENHMINKSVRAFLNVAHALNTNGSHVPYRESKLTYLLRDSLGRTSKILLVACLPSICQDSIHMLSLACRGTVSANKSKSLARPVLSSSHKGQILRNVCTTERKLPETRSHLFEKKATCTTSTIKGRKLFDEENQFTKSEKASSLSATVSIVQTSMSQEEISIEDVTKSSAPLLLDNTFSDIGNDVESNHTEQKDITMQSEHHHEEQTPGANNCSKVVSSIEEEDGSLIGAHKINKENNSSAANEIGSPLLSVQLREISNNLKSLYYSTPLAIQPTMSEDSGALSRSQVPTNIGEPQTPTNEQSMRVNDRWDATNVHSPWETFSMCNSGMKNSLIQEYLRFLNTANKEDLKRLKGIGEKRATFILELREESPEPFKSLDDLKDIGLSEKQVKGMMKKEVGGLFD
ncbi:Kinesin-like protein [Quillaja saponaria]|uniref:Kinesin-like protein n=1 Tax=Quillaja saponaria TaxID=32244 RepID=A0AAD7PWX9_QUISA|nr:Kinesin-like protein [Quillaja saponaria]